MIMTYYQDELEAGIFLYIFLFIYPKLQGCTLIQLIFQLFRGQNSVECALSHKIHPLSADNPQQPTIIYTIYRAYGVSGTGHFLYRLQGGQGTNM